MRYAQMRPIDISNGPGVRTTLFVTGCTHACPNCFNEEYQSFKSGEKWTEEDEQKFMTYVSNPNVVGVNILGGEPMQQIKDDSLLNLLKKIKMEYPNKPIWLWTGYALEDFMISSCNHFHQRRWDILRCIDVLIDGRYKEDLKDVRLKYRGSSNQRVIDMKRYLDGDGIIELDI